MKAKIRNLVKNPRYKLLHIENDHYIMDMGAPFWKVIFPFFFWICPNTIYKVDDQERIKQLKAPLSQKQGFSAAATYAGIGVLIPNLTGSIMDYFDIYTPLWLNITLLIVALISVVFLYSAFNQRYKEKLHHTVHPELLPHYKIRLHPKSFGHVFKFFLAYVFILGMSVLSYMLYIDIQNVLALLFASFLLFIILISGRVTAQDGTATVTFKEGRKHVS